MNLNDLKQYKLKYKTFAETFHKILLHKIVNRKKWVQEIAQCLNLGIDAIYKKSRLESSYSIDEFLLLTEKYHIQFNEVKFFATCESDFHYIKLNDNLKLKNLYDYIQFLEDFLKAIKGMEIQICTSELPVFYLLQSEVTLQYLKDLTDFDSETRINNALIEKSKRIWSLYCSLGIEEVWTEGVEKKFTKDFIQFLQDKNYHNINTILESTFLGKNNKLVFVSLDHPIHRHVENKLIASNDVRKLLWFEFNSRDSYITTDIDLVDYFKSKYQTLKHEIN